MCLSRCGCQCPKCCWRDTVTTCSSLTLPQFTWLLTAILECKHAELQVRFFFYFQHSGHQEWSCLTISQRNGYTALHVACEIADVVAVQLLLENDADSHLASFDGRLPIDLAVAGHHSACIVCQCYITRTYQLSRQSHSTNTFPPTQTPSPNTAITTSLALCSYS